MPIFTIEASDIELPMLDRDIEEYRRSGGSVVVYLAPGNPALTTNALSGNLWHCEVKQDFLDRFQYWTNNVIRRS